MNDPRHDIRVRSTGSSATVDHLANFDAGRGTICGTLGTVLSDLDPALDDGRRLCKHCEHIVELAEPRLRLVSAAEIWRRSIEQGS